MIKYSYIQSKEANYDNNYEIKIRRNNSNTNHMMSRQQLQKHHSQQHLKLPNKWNVYAIEHLKYSNIIHKKIFIWHALFEHNCTKVVIRREVSWKYKWIL